MLSLGEHTVSVGERSAAGNPSHWSSLLSRLSASFKALSSAKLVVLNARAISDQVKLWTCNSMRARNHGDFEKVGTEF